MAQLQKEISRTHCAVMSHTVTAVYIKSISFLCMVFHNIEDSQLTLSCKMSFDGGFYCYASARSTCQRPHYFLCLLLLKQSLSERQCQNICTSLKCQDGGCRPFHPSYTHTHTHFYQAMRTLFFTVTSPVTQSNMSDKSTAQRGFDFYPKYNAHTCTHEEKYVFLRI